MKEQRDQNERHKLYKSALFVLLTIALLTLLFSEACTTLDTRKEIINRNNWSDKVIRLVNNSTVVPGMTPQMVIAAWGYPIDVNKTTTESYVREQWVYGTVYNRGYVYFRNDTVTTIQTNQ